MKFILFLLFLNNLLSSYVSGFPPPDWAVHRNSEFAHYLSRSPTMMHDWIFSKDPARNSGVNNYQSVGVRPDSVSLPLYGSVHATAYWFADVYFGSPQQQRQSLIIDTGSSVMGFPCSDCRRRCGRHIDSPYNTSDSRSVRPVQCFRTCPLCRNQAPLSAPQTSLSSFQQCAYHVRYTEGSSLTGAWYEDKRHDAFGGDTNTQSSISVMVPFGCHSEETHLFLSQDASGILGLEATSRFGPPPFVTSVLAELLGLKKVIGGALRDMGLSQDRSTQSGTEPVFAVCLSQDGGIMTIGNPSRQFHIRNDTVVQTSQTRFTESNIPEYNSQGMYYPRLSNQWPQEQSHTVNSPQQQRSNNRRSDLWNVHHGDQRQPIRSSRPGRRSLESNNKDFKIASLNIEQSRNIKYQNNQENDSNKRQIYETINQYQWMPLVVDPEEDGGWPGSYIAVLRGWKIKSENAETVLTVPYSTEPLRTRESHLIGLPALIDSGTTLTYLPFLLYASLWSSLLKNIALATHRTRRLMEGDMNILRVTGMSVSKMKEKLDHHIELLKVETNTIRRQMRDTRGNSGKHSRVEKELQSAEGLRREMEELTLLIDEQDQMVSETHEFVNENEATKRIFHNKQNDQIKTFLSNNDIDDIDDSAPPLRRLMPVTVSNTDEECWFLSNAVTDLGYFPDMVLEFANNVEHVWKPSSYLYRKGKAKVYCLTIVADDTDGQRTLDDRILQQKPTKQAVLGSSFFIHHDLIFHLGRWEVATVEAYCPSTNLDSRKS